MAKYLTFTYRGRIPEFDTAAFPKRGQLATLRRLTAENHNLSIMLVDRDGDWIAVGPVTCSQGAGELRLVVEHGRLKKVHPTYFDC